MNIDVDIFWNCVEYRYNLFSEQHVLHRQCLINLFSIQHTLSSLLKGETYYTMASLNTFSYFIMQVCLVTSYGSLYMLLHFIVQTWSLPNYQTCFAQGNKREIFLRLSLKQIQSLTQPSSNRYQLISQVIHSMIESFGSKQL